MSYEQLIILTAGVATLAIFSFLIRENPFYRIFEHIFIGIAASWGIVLVIKNFFYPMILVPMLGLNRMQFPDGSWSEPYNPLYLLYLVPLFLGFLYYTVHFPRWSWLSNVAIGITLGAAGGLAFKGFFNQMLPQLTSSFKPLIVLHDGAFDVGSTLNNIIFVTTLVVVMYYFFFTFNRSRGGEKVAAFGRYLMMVCFGAYFGSTVMARMALLVERLNFLLTDFTSTLIKIFV